MTAPKPVPCPLLPGVEPLLAEGYDYGSEYVWAPHTGGGYVQGPVRSGSAEAITAWNEWMNSIEVKHGR